MDNKDKSLIKTFENKETLSLDFFDKKNDEYNLKKDIRKKLLEISDNFIEFLGVKFFIHDIVLVGSITDYNWSKYSDVDLHIIIDFKNSKHNPKILSEFFNSKKNLWNSTHDIKINNYNVELYVEDINEKNVFFNGIFSILNNKWIKKPIKNNKKINYDLILKKSDVLIKEINKTLKNPTIKEIKKILDKIKKLRMSGLSKSGLFSIENLTYKYLRRRKYINLLYDTYNKLLDKELSLKK